MPGIVAVAKDAGVSPTTVSRVFGRPELVAHDTQERVREAAERLGYVTNKAARGLVTGRTGNVGIVVPDIANPFFAPLIKAAQGGARQRDVDVFLADTDEDPRVEAAVLTRLANQVDGLVVCSSRLPEDDLMNLARTTPLVLVNREVASIPAVLIDAQDGMRQAGEHLAALGHREVAYLGGPEVSWSNTQRLRGLQQATRRHRVKVHVLGPYIPNTLAGIHAADMALATKATAVVAYDDLMAAGVVLRLANRGVAVPAEVSVVGCDDVDLAQCTQPPLTTITGRADLAGKAAVELLREVIDAAPTTLTGPLLLPTQLVVRASSGPVPAVE